MISKSLASVTRPNNTTAYTAGDEISNNATAIDAVPLQFNGLTEVRPATCDIKRAKLTVNTQGFTGNVKLYLFNDLPTMSGDNAPHKLLLEEQESFMGVVSFLGFQSPTGSTCSISVVTQLNFCLISKDYVSSNPFYGVLIADGDITPASEQVFTVELFSEPFVNVN